ncbi:glucose-6-phosphate dehydrogenase [Paracoccaceae bacterium GXU_MW_L88]
MVARVIPVEPFDLVIFGATGDLAHRKIFPGLYRRRVAGQMPAEARIIGAARSTMSNDAFRKDIRAAIEEYVPKSERDAEQVEGFLEQVSYSQLDVTDQAGWDALKETLRDDVVRAFYLSVAPSLFGTIADYLSKNKIATKDSRIVVEKPLGKDLESAEELNRQLSASFDERQIYRIDHYLGKETVQNLLAIRFANSLFEPLWTAAHVDHVQITVAEDIGVAGRGGYYDKSGAMRDMVQNHLMQLLCLTAMEPPAKFEPDLVRDEKLKVIRALGPVAPGEIVRGQYENGKDSYKKDAENAESLTESFIAMKVHVENWRWAGTPFYLRTGKKMAKRVSEIAVVFKDPPHSIFPKEDDLHGNALLIRLQPDEGITLHMAVKEPGPGGMRLSDAELDMSFADALEERKIRMPDAYERLIMDVIRGDQTLFMRGDEVEAAWAWVDPIIQEWTERGDRPKPYDPGSAGPEDAMVMLHKEGRRWRKL